MVSSSLPQEIITKLHNSRRLLLQPQTTLAPSPSHQLESSSSQSNNSFDANVVMVLSVLICAVICSLCVNSLIKCLLKCLGLLTGDANYLLNMISHEKVSNGVDKRALKRFPVVKYSKQGKIQGLSIECVICLSEFKEGEKLRILPKCNHGFHVKCIDKWLSSQSSCPTCRQSLVETCQKIIGSEIDHCHVSSSSSAAASSVGVTGEMIAISIVPLERENMVRNYRAQIGES